MALQLIYDYYKVATDYYYTLRIGTDIFFIASHAHVRGVTPFTSVEHLVGKQFKPYDLQ